MKFRGNPKTLKAVIEENELAANLYYEAYYAAEMLDILTPHDENYFHCKTPKQLKRKNSAEVWNYFQGNARAYSKACAGVIGVPYDYIVKLILIEQEDTRLSRAN